MPSSKTFFLLIGKLNLIVWFLFKHIFWGEKKLTPVSTFFSFPFFPAIITEEQNLLWIHCAQWLQWTQSFFFLDKIKNIYEKVHRSWLKWYLSQKLSTPMAKWVRQHCSEALAAKLNLSFYYFKSLHLPIFFQFFNTTSKCLGVFLFRHMFSQNQEKISIQQGRFLFFFQCVSPTIFIFN